MPYNYVPARRLQWARGRPANPFLEACIKYSKAIGQPHMPEGAAHQGHGGKELTTEKTTEYIWALLWGLGRTVYSLIV